MSTILPRQVSDEMASEPTTSSSLDNLTSDLNQVSLAPVSRTLVRISMIHGVFIDLET